MIIVSNNDDDDDKGLELINGTNGGADDSNDDGPDCYLYHSLFVAIA